MYVTHGLYSSSSFPTPYLHTSSLWVGPFLKIVASQHVGQDQVHNRCSMNTGSMNELNNTDIEIKDLKSCIPGDQLLDAWISLSLSLLFFSFGLLFFPVPDTIFHSLPPPGAILSANSFGVVQGTCSSSFSPSALTSPWLFPDLHL